MSRRNFIRSAVLDMAGVQTSVTAEKIIESKSPVMGDAGLPQHESVSLRLSSGNVCYAGVAADDDFSVAIQVVSPFGDLVLEKRILQGLLSRPSVLGIYKSPNAPAVFSVMCLGQEQGRGSLDLIQIEVNGSVSSVVVRTPTVLSDMHTKWLVGVTNPYYHSPGLIYSLDLIQPDQSFKTTTVVQNLETRNFTPLVTPTDHISASAFSPVGDSIYAFGSVEYDNPKMPGECKPYLTTIDGAQSVPAVKRSELSLAPLFEIDPTNALGVSQEAFRDAASGSSSVDGDAATGKVVFAANVQSDTNLLGSTRHSTMLWSVDGLQRDDDTTTLTRATAYVPSESFIMPPLAPYGVSAEGFWNIHPRPENNGVEFEELFLDSNHSKLGAFPVSDAADNTFLRYSISGKENTLVGYRAAPYAIPSQVRIERISISATVQVQVVDEGEVTLAFGAGSVDKNYPSVLPQELFGLKVWRYDQGSYKGTHTLYSPDIPMQNLFGPGQSLRGPIASGGLVGGIYVADSTSREASLTVTDVKIKIHTKTNA